MPEYQIEVQDRFGYRTTMIIYAPSSHEAEKECLPYGNIVCVSKAKTDHFNYKKTKVNKHSAYEEDDEHHKVGYRVQKRSNELHYEVSVVTIELIEGGLIN